MKAETQVRIRRVQVVGRIARWLCAAFLAIVLAFSVWGLLCILTGPANNGFKVDLGRIAFTGEQIDTISLKAWLALWLVVGCCITGRMLWLLRRLFGNMAHGEIYTQRNVRQMRSVGWLMLTGASLQIIVPMISMRLLSTHVIEWSKATHSGFSYFGPGNFGAFAIAGIIILVSWILDVGQDVSEEAESLRREAELVV